MHNRASSTTYHSGREIPNVSGGGDDLVREARENAQAAWEYDRENREDGFVDLRFLAADQWPAAIRQERESAGRPCLTINRLPQFIYQVANDIRTNPPGIKIVPNDESGKNQETKDLADIYSGMIRSIENASGGPHLYATAGTHAIACGIGSWRIDTQYVNDDVFDQEIVMKPIRHPFAVLWDPAAIMPARQDGEWCQVTQLIHRLDFKKRFPGASEASFDVPIPGNDPEAGLFWRSGDWLRLIEYWRKVERKKKLAMFGGGEVIDITKLKRPQMEQLVTELGEPIRERDVDAKVVKSSLLSAVDVLEPEEEWPGLYIPIISTIGGEIPLDTKVVRFGLVRFARDAQQLYNYARSAAAESIGLAPKSPYLLTTKMISRYVDMWNTHNTTQRPYLVYDPDEQQPNGPQRLHPPETPEAFFREQQIAVEDMKATTGIYDASLGARGNETSGVAINARDRQGDTATAHFMANLITSMVHCGRVLVDLIPRIYDTQRVIRIMGEDDTEDFVPINHVVLSDKGEPVLLNDLSQGKYEVRPRTGPSYTTKRLEAADSMLQFAQAVPGAAAIIGDLIALNMDWPGADQIAERLKRAIPPQIVGEDAEDANTPEGQAKKQAADKAAQLAATQTDLAIAEMQAKINKLNADTDKSGAQALNDKIDALIKVLQSALPPEMLKTVLAGGAGSPAGGAAMPGMGAPAQPNAAGAGAMPAMQGAGAMSPAGAELGGGMMNDMGLPQGDLSEFLGAPDGGQASPLPSGGPMSDSGGMI